MEFIEHIYIERERDVGDTGLDASVAVSGRVSMVECQWHVCSCDVTMQLTTMPCIFCSVDTSLTLVVLYIYIYMNGCRDSSKGWLDERV